MVTSESARPGMSTPCQKPSVAKRHEVSSRGELLEQASLGQVALQQQRVGDLGGERLGGRLGGPPAGEEGERASARRLEQLRQLLVQRLLRALGAPVGQVPGHVEQRVGAVVEGAAHVELLGREGLEADALDDARRDGRAGQHRRHLAPEHRRQRRPDVDGGEAQPHVAPRPVDPGHLAVVPRLETVQVVGEVGGRLQRAGLAARPVGIGRLALAQEAALRPAPPQRVGDPPAQLGGLCHGLGQLAVVARAATRPAFVVLEHAGPDPLSEQRTQPVAGRRQRLEQRGVAWFDQGPSGGDERADSARA